MPKSSEKKDFNFYIDEYLYHCHSRRLRPRTMASYEQALRLFERWLQEVERVTTPGAVKEQMIAT